MDLGRVRAGPARHTRLPRELARELDLRIHVHQEAVHKYGGVPIYTDGAGWYADACRWAGVERIVYGHPLKNLMEHGPVRRGRDGGVRRPLPGRRAQAEIGTRLRARAQLAISVHVHAGLRVRERGPGMDGGPRF